MEVSGQIHALGALLPEKEPPVPTGWEAGWAVVAQREIPAPAGNGFRLFSPQPSYYTELSQLVGYVPRTWQKARPDKKWNIIPQRYNVTTDRISCCFSNRSHSCNLVKGEEQSTVSPQMKFYNDTVSPCSSNRLCSWDLAKSEALFPKDAISWLIVNICIVCKTTLKEASLTNTTTLPFILHKGHYSLMKVLHHSMIKCRCGKGVFAACLDMGGITNESRGNQIMV
jgi:hypothetical protein